jgi:ribosomal protection tetracycline resistance protein
VQLQRPGSADADEEKVTAIASFAGADAVRSQSVTAGQIAKLWGLDRVQIGDVIGAPPSRVRSRASFAPPTLESVVVPREPSDEAALYLALSRLAEQDPLIDVRRDATRNQLSVSLYGEVQMEVIQASLADDFGIDVDFGEATVIHVERPRRAGEALEELNTESNPFRATIGLRVEPSPVDAGIEFRMDVDPRTTPLYVYKTFESFGEHMETYVRDALRVGLFGWEVTDCIVTLTQCAYSVPDGPPSRRGPLSTASDFRKLTPLVLGQALELAQTVVCEPMVRATLEVPAESIGGVLALLARLGGSEQPPSLDGEVAVVEALFPVARTNELHRELPRLTRGEGLVETEFAGYRPVTIEPPTRR